MKIHFCRRWLYLFIKFAFRGHFFSSIWYVPSWIERSNM